LNINGISSLTVLVIRDYDGWIYAREWSGGLLSGGFENEGKPVFLEGIPDNFEFQLLPEDWAHFRNKILIIHHISSLSFK